MGLNSSDLSSGLAGNKPVCSTLPVSSHKRDSNVWKWKKKAPKDIDRPKGVPDMDRRT